ncbi:MAG TPA: penicillin-insensitive murein endopeptidase [Pyrinomonadaceae bacterium]|jgi:hypothetical protein
MYLRTLQGLADSLTRDNLGAWATRSLPATINGKLYAFESAHGGSTTAVYVPDAALGTDPLNLLVWIHGDLICGDEGATAVTYVKSKTFPFAKQLADSKRPFVLVAPSMNWKGNSSHRLGAPKAMNAFLEEVRNGLTGAGWSSPPRFGRLILAGHSRGYAVLNHLVERLTDNEFSQGGLATLSDIWLFDTTYGQKNKQFHCTNWTGWAKTKRGVNVRILYRETSPTAPVAECIRNAARAAGLTNITVTPFKPKALTHCAMPAVQLPILLSPNGSQSAGSPTSTQKSDGSLVQQIQTQLGRDIEAVRVAVLAGNRDQNQLTNKLFFAQHPELKRRKLLPSEPGFKQLSHEWLRIRDTIIRPLIASTVRQSPAQLSQAVNGRKRYPEVNTPMPLSGPGFIRQKDEGRSFGLPETISALTGIAAAWHRLHPQGPRIGIRDISRQGGGKLSPHKSHQVGLDVDLMLEDGKASWYRKKGPKVNNRYKWELNSTYSRALTAELARLILEHPKGGLKIKFILFDDPQIRSVSTKVKKDDTSLHLDHLHVRFCAPAYFAAKVDRKFTNCT